MSSYPVLDNKPIDQWKVTELKEELKKRKLATKGLKDDLIRRLDEALRAERDTDEDEDGNEIEIVEVEHETPNGEATEKEEEASQKDRSSEKEEEASQNDRSSEKEEEASQNDRSSEKEEKASQNDRSSEKEEEASQNDKSTEKVEEAAQKEKSTEKEEAAAQKEKSTEKEEVVVPNELDTEKKEETILNESEIAKDEEVVHNEKDSVKEELDNGLDCEAKPQDQSEDVEPKAIATPMILDTKVHDDSETAKLDNNVSGSQADCSPAKLDRGKLQEGESQISIDTVEVVSHTTVVAGSVEASITESRSEVTVASSGLESQNNDIKVEEDSMPSHDDAMLNDSNPNNQVSEVSPSLGFQVKSDSISTDSVSINEELKDNLNADNFHIELDNVKPEMVQPSSSDVPYNGGDIHPLDDEPCENQGSIEEIDDINATNVDLGKKNDSGDGGSSEKLNLDRSSGDDSMEEDVLESKQVESNHIFDELEDRSELTKDHVMKEGSPVGAAGAGFSPVMKDVSMENNNVAAPAEKRKLEDHEVVRNNEPPKRQRRWNTEPLKVPDPQSSNLTPSTTPKDVFQSKFSKRSFNRSDSTLSGGDTPKERVVPPSPKSPTTSLKIDRFLRPFTLKAVQELLAKTGTVCSFWMDHIKTHCYVTFSSVEEAVETRNALYNLQWPPNGGRLLVAEFVEPQEVKLRADAPPQPSPAPVVNKPAPFSSNKPAPVSSNKPAPVSSNKPAPPAAPSQPQPSPRQIVLKQQLPPPPSTLPLPPPPPPPLSDPHTVKERLPLPPPPPLPKKPDPPIVTLDDLFKKTRATPRIYYLPLSEEQVAAKLAAQGKNTK